MTVEGDDLRECPCGLQATAGEPWGKRTEHLNESGGGRSMPAASRKFVIQMLWKISAIGRLNAANCSLCGLRLSSGLEKRRATFGQKHRRPIAEGHRPSCRPAR